MFYDNLCYIPVTPFVFIAKVMNEQVSAQDSYKLSATNVEETKLNQETTSEQKAALFLQIPEFQRQVEVRQNDLQGWRGRGLNPGGKPGRTDAGTFPL